VRGFGKPSSAAIATERLFAECRDSLIRYLRYHLEDLSEAEDLCQEAFIRYFNALNRKEEITQARAWLFRVAHNLLVDHGRKRKPELLDEKAWVALEARRSASGAGSRVEARLYVSQLPWQRLRPMERECLRLRAEGLKFREIGEVLGLSISTVVSYISRALQKLRAGSEGSRSDAPNHGRTAATP